MARITPVNSGYLIINGSATGSNGARIDVWAEYSVLSQNVYLNTSRLRVFFYAALRQGQTSNTQYKSGLNATLYVDGAAAEGVVNAAYDFTSPENIHELARFEGDIAHEQDGSKSVAVSGSFTTRSSYISGGNINAQINLPAIARLSDLSCESEAELGSEMHVSILAKEAAYHHLLRIVFSDRQLECEVPANENQAVISLPLDFAEAMPNAQKAQATVFLYTYSGSALLGSVSKVIALCVPERIIPTFETLSLSYGGGDAPQEWGVYVQSKSKVKAEIIGAKGAYGSSISLYSLEGGGSAAREAAMQTGLLQQAGEISFSGYVKDSRGRQSEVKSAAVNVLPYEAPRLSDVVFFRCAEDGAADQEGGYLHVRFTQQISSCGGHNSAQAVLRFRAQGQAQWQSYTALDASQPNILSGFSPDRSYELMLELSDAFTTTAHADFLQTAERIMNIRADGKGIAFGKMSEKEGLEVQWRADFAELPAVGGKPLMDYIYPVGSIYMSMNNVGPDLLFGGTWAQISGTFLLPATSSGVTGGEETHILTEAEIPAHTHWIYDDEAGGQQYHHTWATTWKGINETVKGSAMPWSGGEGKAHNNMPPYITVYCWQRIA